MRAGMMCLGFFVALGGLILPLPATACDPATPSLHSIDPDQVGVDQTPPQLGQPAVAEIQNFDHGSDGCASKCGWDHSVRLINLGTDDMTPTDRMGYRVTLTAGVAPHLTISTVDAFRGLADGSLTLYWDGDDDFDFTLQLVAVDAAGNESVPKTVRVSHGGGCTVGRRRVVSDGFALVVVALAAAWILRRRR